MINKEFGNEEKKERLPFPNAILYCVKNVFFPDEIKNYKTMEEAEENAKRLNKGSKCLYKAYTLNFYEKVLERDNVIEVIYNDNNKFIASKCERGYEFYHPEESNHKGSPVWEYDPTFIYINSDYNLLDDKGLINEETYKRVRKIMK